MMGWRDLLEQPSARLVAPWLGGRRIHRDGRTYRVLEKPEEYGWYVWEVSGREVKLLDRHEPDLDYTPGPWACRLRGHLIGNRLITDNSQAAHESLGDAVRVFLVERGIDRFSPVEAGLATPTQFIYRNELFSSEVEDAVRKAFVDRADNVNHIPGVTPALERAFSFAVRQRQDVEARRAELARLREEERRREEAERSMGTGLGRRNLATFDFESAARAALMISGTELLDVRPGRTQGEMIVQFRLENSRFECVVDRSTLRIVDSGICLTDGRTGEKGDSYFTLESLPSVIRQAIWEDKLVIYRHVN